MNEFWQEFEARIARLQNEADALKQDIVRWDEIPDSSVHFIFTMERAYWYLRRAIDQLEEARREGGNK